MEAINVAHLLSQYYRRFARDAEKKNVFSI